MIVKHVLKEVKSKWVSITLLGIIIALSSFIYTTVDLGIGTIETNTNAYFDEYVQEDFALELSALLTPSDRDYMDEECLSSAFTLEALYREDRACFNTVLNARLETLESIEGIALEARLFKDRIITSFDSDHTVRIFRQTSSINKTYLQRGSLPENDGEIAVLKNYANANALQIGDTVNIGDTDYEISGFILVPDYNLPALIHPFLFTTDTQTIAVMHNETFDNLGGSINYHVAGIFTEESFDLDQALDDADIDFLMSSTLTRNNLRSGAIYTEIEGSKGAALFISVMIASVGIVIAGLLMKKIIDQSRRPFGILRALGMKENELFIPFIVLLSLYSFLFLVLGYYLGYLSAPSVRDFFLSFYLLPSGAITLTVQGIMVAVFVPMAVILGMTMVILHRLLRLSPLELLKLKVEKVSKLSFTKFKMLFDRLSFYIRMQIAFLLRNIVKVSVYALGVFFALLLSFVSIGLYDVFSGTIDGYYDSIDVKSVGYFSGLEDTDEPHEKVIEMNGTINGNQAFFIGLNNDTALHPLFDASGNDLRNALSDGVVISKSFALLSSLQLGDDIMLRLGGTSYEAQVSGVADIYPGEHVFMDRALMGEVFFENSDFYNAAYSNEILTSDVFIEVFNTEDLLQSIESINDIIMNVLYIAMASGLAIGMIIIYLLSVLTVEDQYYNIALFKVLGYQDKEINRMLLGGYDKLNVVILLLVIPTTLGIFQILTWFMANEYQMIMTFSLSVAHVFLIAGLYGIIYVLASLHAKRKVKAVSLQAALKIYQR